MIAICTIVFLSGCGEHDKAYYEANIGRAETKVKECDEAIKKALKENQIETVRALSEDSECRAADSVYHQHKQKIREKEYEIQRQEREEKDKAEAEKFAADYNEQLAVVKVMPYKDFLSGIGECRLERITTAKCKAFFDSKTERDKAEVESLKETYINGELERFNKKVCRGLAYDEMNCQLSQTAIREQQKEKVEYYLANREVLKNDFNQCRSNYTELSKTMKSSEASTKAYQTYTCLMVKRAASRLKIYNFREAL